MFKIINEHNELFYELVTHYSSHKPLTYIHIDEHDDFFSPIVDKNKINSSKKEDMIYLTYNQLRISDFILALVYKGIINDIFWISNDDASFIFKFDIKVNSLLNNKISISAFQSDNSRYYFEKSSVNNSIDIINHNIIICIDLDYFSCDDITGESLQLELSKNELNRFEKDKYHSLRLQFGSRVQILDYKKNLIEIKSYHGENKINDLNIIDKKINLLKKWTEKNLLTTDIKKIYICKSSKSGYIDKNRANYIINKLKERCIISKEE